ncbi:MAG: hypothetical protein M3Y87_12405 [Myxococcota bacterium]|nr:hypothetical protein [Myxococcota bacterium]
MNPVDDAWTPLIATPDGATSTVPNPRWGIRAQVEYPASAAPGMVWFSGALRGGLADQSLWQLGDDGQWLLHQVDPSSSLPSRRKGASIFAAACSSSPVAFDFVVVGGEGPSSTLLNDAWRLGCGADGLECRWEAITSAGALSGRADAAVVVPNHYGSAFLFGGRTSIGDSDELFSMNPCGTPATWVEVVVTGSAPGPRSGHTMSIVHAVEPDLPSAILFGGSTTSEQVHRLTFESTTAATWAELAVAPGASPGPMRNHVAWWDGPRRRLVVFTGDDDVWELRVRP